MNLEECKDCGLSGWDWQDNGWGSGVLGPRLYFAATGTQRIRIQTREDGLSIDRIVLSPSTYLNTAPPAPTGSSTTATNVVIDAGSISTQSGAWDVQPYSGAINGTVIRHPDAGAAKRSTALASPTHYFETTFQAVAGTPYRLWIHGRADRDSWANDSVFVQFSTSVEGGAARYRIGTTSALEVNLEECSGCGLSGWGWQDTGWGAGVLGPEVIFVAGGTQRMRIQTREDGFTIDQVVLSPQRYLTSAPGATKNDTTIVPR